MRSTIALPMLVLPRALGCRWMRAVLDYCTGGIQRKVPAGTPVIHEGGTTGHLYVLIEGRLEVLKGDTVVALSARSAAYRDRARGGGFDHLRVQRRRVVFA